MTGGWRLVIREWGVVNCDWELGPAVVGSGQGAGSWKMGLVLGKCKTSHNKIQSNDLWHGKPRHNLLPFACLINRE